MRRQHAQVPQNEQGEVNLTPLLDVVFILLIFFIVTASFAKESGIEISRPGSVLPSEPNITSVTLRVEASGRFSINHSGVASEGLSSYLRGMRSLYPEASFSILVSPKAPTQYLVTAADAARLAGYSEVPVTQMRE